jgi:hypothetical protein
LNKKKNNQWLAFAGIPAQLGVTIYIFNLIGKWIDKTYYTGVSTWEKWITLLGIFVSIYSVIRQVIHISNQK